MSDVATNLSVFCATSLDGFIARDNGSIDWLMNANKLLPLGEDCGYKAFMSTIDGLIMGRHSYEKVMSFDAWPYDNLPVVVMSSQDVCIPEKLRNTVSTSRETADALVLRLKKQGLKHLYIDGGITIQRFLAKNLINELTITVIPVLLGSGRSLFGSLTRDIALQLMSTRAYDCGFMQLKYRVAVSQESAASKKDTNMEHQT